MAFKTTVELVDDIDGVAAAETVSFGLDGREYEIDLSAENAEALRAALAPWVGSARKTTSRSVRMTNVSTAVDTRAVRAWAASNGVELSARGRIPAEVVEHYRAAGN